MINNKKDGIFCDLCTNEYKNKFVYYSVNFKKVDCDKDRGGNAIVDNVMDLDICSECHDKMKEQILENLKIINKIKDKPTDAKRKHI